MRPAATNQAAATAQATYLNQRGALGSFSPSPELLSCSVMTLSRASTAGSSGASTGWAGRCAGGWAAGIGGAGVRVAAAAFLRKGSLQKSHQEASSGESKPQAGQRTGMGQ